MMKSTKILFDSFALIEHLKGSERGMTVQELIGSRGNEIYISVLSLYEVGTVIEREHGKKKRDEIHRSLTTHFHIEDITERISVRAIKLKRIHKLPTVDYLIYASAKILGASIVSGCKHFKSISGESDVIII